MNCYDFEIQIDTLEENSDRIHDRTLSLLDALDGFSINESQCEVWDYEDGCYIQKIEGIIMADNDPYDIWLEIRQRLNQYFDDVWVCIEAD